MFGLERDGQRRNERRAARRAPAGRAAPGGPPAAPAPAPSPMPSSPAAASGRTDGFATTPIPETQCVNRCFSIHATTAARSGTAPRHSWTAMNTCILDHRARHLHRRRRRLRHRWSLERLCLDRHRRRLVDDDQPCEFLGVWPRDGKLCVSGTVAGTSDYSAVAILGISINQAMGTPAPAPSTWTPGGTGITYSIINAGGSPLRVQLQAAGGDTDATKRWCAQCERRRRHAAMVRISTRSAGTTPARITMARRPCESVMVLVPGDLVAVPYNFCIVALAPHP